jgi:hypothetical protein
LWTEAPHSFDAKAPGRKVRKAGREEQLQTAMCLGFLLFPLFSLFLRTGIFLENHV